MKKHVKKLMVLGLALSIVAPTVAIGAKAAVVTGQLYYKDYKIKVDGVTQPVEVEPFSYNGAVYVPVREVGQILNAQVNWNPMTQSVEITQGASGELEELRREVGNKNLKINSLEAKVAELEAKLQQLESEEDKNNTDKDDDKEQDKADLKDILKDIEYKYDEEFDVEWSFELTEAKNTLTLDIDYTSKTDGKAFDAISESKLQKFVKNIVTDIQKAYGDVNVKGTIYDITERKERATFTMSSKGSFNMSIKNSIQLDKEALETYAKELRDAYLRLPSFNIPGYGSEIRVREVVLEERNGQVVYELHTDYMNSRFTDQCWNNVIESQTNGLKDYMDDILDDIEKKLGVKNVKGYLLNEDDKIMGEYEKGDFDIRKL